MQMDSISPNLPDFDNPPVVETVLDVSFAPMAKWGIPYFGLFWEKIKSEYPLFQDQPPLFFEAETSDADKNQPATFSLEFLQEPKARCWFIHTSGARLIQVQDGRFIHNWRKFAGNEEYPHYEAAIRPSFEREWARFSDFLKAEEIGVPDVRQCEISYINHIELESGWQTYSDLVQALSLWPGAGQDAFLPVPERSAFNTSYLMPDGGRLRVNLQPAIRHFDGKPIIQLSLTVRGRPASSETSELLSWFDVGREWIVRGFTEFTTPKMHQLWKRRS